MSKSKKGEKARKKKETSSRNTNNLALGCHGCTHLIGRPVVTSTGWHQNNFNVRICCEAVQGGKELIRPVSVEIGTENCKRGKRHRDKIARDKKQKVSQPVEVQNLQG